MWDFQNKPMRKGTGEVCWCLGEKSICSILGLCGSLEREPEWGPRQGESINKSILKPQMTRLKHSSSGRRHFLSPTNCRDTQKWSQLTFNWEMSFDCFLTSEGLERVEKTVLGTCSNVISPSVFLVPAFPRPRSRLGSEVGGVLAGFRVFSHLPLPVFFYSSAPPLCLSFFPILV